MTSAFATSNLETTDPLIEIISKKVCFLDVHHFRPFESDLEEPIKDPLAGNLLNAAFCDRENAITCNNNKFILVSWDVDRPGLWYGIELFYSRSQFYKMERKWPNGIGRGQSNVIFTPISYDDVQCPGSKVYFYSVNAKKPYYCTILTMGSYASCMEELKSYEALTLHFPLVGADYLVPRGCLELINGPCTNSSCRSELIRLNLLVEQMEKAPKEKLVKSVQLKRTSLAVKQLTLCSSKRQKLK